MVRLHMTQIEDLDGFVIQEVSGVLGSWERAF